MNVEYAVVYGYGMLILGAVIYLTLEHILKKHGFFEKQSIPPGSNGLPLIGETMQFMAAIGSSKGVYEFVRVRHLRYGDCFRTNILGRNHAFVSSTVAAKVILSNEGEIFTKGYIKSIAALVGDKSVLCASPHDHKRIRGHLANLFSTSSLSTFVQHFDQLVVETLEGWEQIRTVFVLREALQITFKAMCKILISLEDGEELVMLEKDVALVYEAMLAVPLKLPWTRFYKGLQARKRIMRTLGKMIALRRKSSEAHHEDFLQRLLTEGDADQATSSSSETLEKLTDEEIQDNILTMIIAGQDTTASAITWMVKYLGENQEFLDALKAKQLHQAAGKGSEKSFLTLDDLKKMPHVLKVVKESLRMASIVPYFPRLVLEDCQLQGYLIKRGWSVNIDAKYIHFDPTIYKDPGKFNPSRFNENDSKPYSYLAFSAGGRTCLGMNMAKAMMLVFLHRLTTNYNWEVIDRDTSIEKWSMFSRLKSGCPIHVTRIMQEVKAAA